MTNQPRVTVLGSLNMDISVTVPRLPAPGATVLGSAATFTPGGKGANQAVAAARLGGQVRMTGCVGDDDFGRQLLGNLRAEQIDVGDVRVTPGVPTGLAMISVDQAGENIITVSPGANHETGEQEVAAATGEKEVAAAAGTTQAGVLVICAEIPIPAIRAALARVGRPLCVLNLAPAPDEAAAIVADGVDWLVVNETEAAAILGHDVDGLAGAARAAQALVTAGARHAVVTAGAHGAAYAGDGAEPVAIEPSPVEAVDSVGAGDAFVGALAVALAAGVPAAEAVRAASAAGATAATRAGAQAGMPRPDDISGTTGVRWPVT